MAISSSRLCPHVETESHEFLDWLASLPVKPCAVKCFSPAYAHAIKDIDPAIGTLVRPYVPDQRSYLAAGADGARRLIDRLGDLTGVNAVEGLNEEFTDAEAIRLLTEFDIALANALKERGVRPVGSSIAVGNPPNWTDILIYAPAANAILQAGGWLNYHGYGPFPLQRDDVWFLHRAPKLLATSLTSANINARWLYTEFGFDQVSSASAPSRPGYRRLIRDGIATLDQIWENYVWADTTSPPEVQALFLYTFCGSSQWADFEHFLPEWKERLAAHWAASLGATSPLAHAEPPGGPVNPPQSTTPPPGSPVTLRVKREQADLIARPDETAAIIGSLPEGVVLTSERKEGDFYQITAWVAAKDVVRVEAVRPDSPIWRGIDVSGYSGDIPLDQLAQAMSKYDLRFIVVQLYGGQPGRRLGINPHAQAVAARARQLGLRVAAYIYNYPFTTIDSREVRALVGAIAPDWLALDIEAKASLSRAQVEVAKRLGPPIVIYTSRSQWQVLMANSSEYASLPLWEALYPAKFGGRRWNGLWPTLDDDPWRATVRGGWRRRAVWQFMGTTQLPFSADLNVADPAWWAEVLTRP